MKLKIKPEEIQTEGKLRKCLRITPEEPKHLFVKDGVVTVSEPRKSYFNLQEVRLKDGFRKAREKFRLTFL